MNVIQYDDLKHLRLFFSFYILGLPLPNSVIGVINFLAGSDRAAKSTGNFTAHTVCKVHGYKVSWVSVFGGPQWAFYQKM